MVKRGKMKITLLYVASVDGKITKSGQGPSKWSSKEDAEYFLSVLRKSKLIVMGSNTFAVSNVKPVEGVLRVVLTSNPQRYKQFELPGQLEFKNEEPQELIERLEKLGFKKMTLVSGRRLTTAFFRHKLIDEVWLTLEPKLFGLGDSLVNDEEFDIELKLVSLQKLNNQGTLLLKYKVEK